jgi:hypothetical protein
MRGAGCSVRTCLRRLPSRAARAQVRKGLFGKNEEPQQATPKLLIEVFSIHSPRRFFLVGFMDIDKILLNFKRLFSIQSFKFQLKKFSGRRIFKGKVVQFYLTFSLAPKCKLCQGDLGCS